MEFVFDPAKDAANVAKHGISLARTSDFILDVMFLDDRRDYGEVRYRAVGRVDGVPHFLVFTMSPTAIRAISLRRAHMKEYRRYVGSP
ncbi:BrnT family toxin [Salinarimonas sp.]|uniref:BrnT family toxin n=1 Tax=Salinarimonas sp. TaxID=2766526 RepID=UPI0032D91CC0